MQNILILEPSTSGLELLPNAHALGLRVFVLSANSDERIIPEEYKKYIHQLAIVDTNHFDAIANAALNLHQQFPFSAVIPGFEIFVAHAARLSELLHVPGVSKEAGEALRNKGKMREVLQSGGIRTPKFQIINSQDDLSHAAKKISFPAVIKPIDQSGSVHVSRVNNIEELNAAYLAMKNDSWTEMGKGIGSVAILEEYISGQELSVEGYVDQKGMHIVSITEKFLGSEPFFVEMGHIVEANLTHEVRQSITSYVKNVITAMQFTVGVFHCELRVDQQGPVLMEISGRLAGDRICDLIYLASGINLYQIMVQCYLGQTINLSLSQPSTFAGIHYFSCPDKSVYTQIYGLDEIQRLPGFKLFKISILAGQTIPPLTSFQGRIGYCIFTAESYSALRSVLSTVQSIVRFD